MGIILGTALKTVASRLLRNAFTRSGKDTPSEDLDAYKDLDRSFKDVTPPPVPTSELTPKEQFLNSIGDRGYGLDEHDSSLYKRLTDDMKVIVDSNYATAEFVKDRLDYTNESLKAVNESIKATSEVAATYGKMNQEAIINSAVKSGSKLGNLFSSLLNGVKDTLLLGLGGVVTAVSNYIKNSRTGTYTGSSGVDLGLDAAIEENTKATKEAREAAEKAKAAAKAQDKKVKDIESSGMWKELSAPMMSTYDSYKNSEFYDENLSGLEGFNALVKANQGFEESVFNLEFTDEEKAKFFDTAKAYRAAELDASKASQDAKAAKKTLDEVISTGDSLKFSRGIATFEAKGFSEIKNKVDQLNSEMQSKSSYERYSYLPELTELKKKAVNLFTDEELESMNIKKKLDPSSTYDDIVAVFENTSGKTSDVDLPAVYDRLTEDTRRQRDVVVRAINNGSVNVYNSEGEKVNPSTTDINKLFSNTQGYGSDLEIQGYTFENSVTGDKISRDDLFKYESYNGLTQSSEVISEFDSTLKELGKSVSDISAMTESQFSKFTEDFKNFVGPDYKLMVSMLTQIWTNTQKNSGSVIIMSEDTKVDVP